MSLLAAPCALCPQERPDPVGAPHVVASSDHWELTVFPGFEVPGWYFLQTRSHVTELDELGPDALSGLGPHLADAVSAIRLAAGREKVYIYRFGETHPHWHLLLCARDDALPAEARGAQLLSHRRELRDERQARVVATTVAARLSRTGSWSPAADTDHKGC